MAPPANTVLASGPEPSAVETSSKKQRVRLRIDDYWSRPFPLLSLPERATDLHPSLLQVRSDFMAESAPRWQPDPAGNERPRRDRFVLSRASFPAHRPTDPLFPVWVGLQMRSPPFTVTRRTSVWRSCRARRFRLRITKVFRAKCSRSASSARSSSKTDFGSGMHAPTLRPLRRAAAALALPPPAPNAWVAR
jgi:hypothetical protein